MQASLEARGQRLAKLAGMFYVFLIVAAAPVMTMFPRLIVRGDASATAANLLANEGIVRLAFAGYLVSTAAYLVVMGLLYTLFRPVNREVALIAVLFSIMGCALSAVSMLFVTAPLTLIGASHSAVLGAKASGDLALLLTDFHFAMFNIGMVFFGLQCGLTGWLIFKSDFLPRLLGILLMVGGIGYLAHLFPPLARMLFPIHVLPGYMGELAITLWLLLRGVDTKRWAERVRSSGTDRLDGL